MYILTFSKWRIRWLTLYTNKGGGGGGGVTLKLNVNKYFCGRVPWLYRYWPGGFMLFVVLCPGTPEGSTGSGSGFKASQKTGQRLKVSPDRLGKAGNRTCDPWFTRHRFIPYTTAASLNIVTQCPKTALKHEIAIIYIKILNYICDIWNSQDGRLDSHVYWTTWQKYIRVTFSFFGQQMLKSNIVFVVMYPDIFV